jgi:DHA2 family methylenomycin A resistance protein-like MFS transporter
MTVSVGSPSRTATRSRRAPQPVLVAALLGFSMIGLDALAVNVALPEIGRALGGSTLGLQWIVDAYTLMFAALLLSAGALSDRFGAKRVYATGLTVFTAASAACGLAPALGVLIVARLVQGGAAAVMLPSSLALVRQAYPDTGRRARAIAVWTAGGAVAAAAGPIAGVVLTTATGWRMIFFLNLPVSAVILAVLARVPRSPRRTAPLDVPGQLTAVIALGVLAYGVIEGGEAGFGRPVVLGCLAGSAIALVAFVAVEARAATPMVPLHLFRSPIVTACVAIGFSVNAAFYGIVFVFGLFFQEILGMSAMAAGLMFVPMTALIFLANIGSARAAARFGPRLPIAVGQLLAAAGLLAVLRVDAGTGRATVAVLLIPLGIGLGFAVPSLTNVLLDNISPDRAGIAGGVLNSMRQTGGAVAVAVFGGLVAGRTTFVPGLHHSLLIAAALLTMTAAVALSLPGGR